MGSIANVPQSNVRRSQTAPVGNAQLETHTTFSGRCPQCSHDTTETSRQLNISPRPIEIRCQKCHFRLLAVDASALNVLPCNGEWYGSDYPYPTFTITRTHTSKSGAVTAKQADEWSNQMNVSDDHFTDNANGSKILTPEPLVGASDLVISQSAPAALGLDQVAQQSQKKRYRTGAKIVRSCNSLLRRFGWSLQFFKTTKADSAAASAPAKSSHSHDTSSSKTPRAAQQPAVEMLEVPGRQLTRPSTVYTQDISTGRNSTSATGTLVPEEQESEAELDIQPQPQLDLPINEPPLPTSSPPEERSSSHTDSKECGAEMNSELATVSFSTNHTPDLLSDHGSDTISEHESIVGSHHHHLHHPHPQHFIQRQRRATPEQAQRQRNEVQFMGTH